ncbi:MAG: Glyoxylate reductase [Promethearchaeota archaeon]|nr:MAG: Glyoxylate reductase [Candidatus Lokiarchaeota archaeon]
MKRPKVFFTSTVFSSNELGLNERIDTKLREEILELWDTINSIADVKVYDGRFPTKEEIAKIIKNFDPNFIGCHLSHEITADMLSDSNVYGISTSTAGFNHIERPEQDNILITHTPGVLHETVADYTIALIMANLRNLIDLHNYVWNEQWDPEEKWDLDQNLSSVINNKKVGIVGLGEIGSELMKRLYLWGMKIMYYDIQRFPKIEKLHPGLEFKENLEDLFAEADVVSLHIPLNKHTEKLIDKRYLKLMKKNALLVNTARGGILQFEDLLDLLENDEIDINLAFDVYPEEPIEPTLLKRFKELKKRKPKMRIIFCPHNASADADTRGKMDIIFLKDLIGLIKSSKKKDLKHLNIIPPHKNDLLKRNWKIVEYWED